MGAWFFGPSTWWARDVSGYNNHAEGYQTIKPASSIFGPAVELTAVAPNFERMQISAQSSSDPLSLVGVKSLLMSGYLRLNSVRTALGLLMDKSLNSSGGFDSGEGGWNLSIQTAGNLSFYIDGDISYLGGSGEMPFNRWFHLTVYFRDISVQASVPDGVYVNGDYSGFGLFAFPPNAPGTATLEMGLVGSVASSGRSLNGWIDHIAMFVSFGNEIIPTEYIKPLANDMYGPFRINNYDPYWMMSPVAVTGPESHRMFLGHNF